MASLANQAAQITGSIAGKAFDAAFDPFGAKQTAADTAKDEKQRKIERHETEMDLKELQIEQAKMQAALQKDAAQAAKYAQKFAQTNQSPDVAAEMYNSMNFGDEMMFDQAHFDSTGEYRFKRGSYQRNDDGSIVRKNGLPVFDATKPDVNYGKDKQAMIDDTMQFTLDPKVRFLNATKDIDIEKFKKTTEIREESKERSADRQLERDKELAETKGKLNLAVAKEQVKGRLGDAGSKQRKSTFANPITNENDELNDTEVKSLQTNAKVLSKRVSKEFLDDPDFDKADEDLFTMPEAYAIMQYKKSDFFKSNNSFIKKLKSIDELDNTVKSLVEAGLPEQYAQFLVNKRRKELTEE